MTVECTTSTGSSWQVAGLRFIEVLELGVRSSMSQYPCRRRTIMCLAVALSDCIYYPVCLGGLLVLVITSNA